MRTNSFARPYSSPTNKLKDCTVQRTTSKVVAKSYDALLI